MFLWVEIVMAVISLTAARVVGWNRSTFPAPALSLPVMANANEHSLSEILRSSSDGRRRLLSTPPGGKQTEIYHMLGSFYSHIWVGTPPQRMSVIVDTGSHHTAFPCVGCSCGKHMDPYFDPKKSSTSKVPSCSGARCIVKQSYSEGSSWFAYKVRDKVWVGGDSLYSLPNARNLSTMFEFACQYSETGLFRTQHVDGIMGLSGAEDTYPHVLYANGLSKSKVFALCFRLGGGVLTIGGVDTSLHSASSSPAVPPVVFAKQVSRKTVGWFTVRLLDVLLRNSKTGETSSIGVPQQKYNTGKGAIIDSGTTDTYLPSLSKSQFTNLFRQMSGLAYSNSKRELTKEEYDNLPTVIYRLEGSDGKPIDIESPPSSYVESLVKKSLTGATSTKYAFRIYLTEPQGTVLGANFMLGHNVIFDYDARQIGFAKSDCQAKATAEDLENVFVDYPRSPAEIASEKENIKLEKSIGTFQYLENIVADYQKSCSGGKNAILTSACSASCQGDSSNYYFARGTQTWARRLDCSNRTAVAHIDEPCSVFCAPVGRGMQRFTGSELASTSCPVSAWSTCFSNCTQHRVISTFAGGLFRAKSECVSAVEARECNAFSCPVESHHVVTFEVSVKNMPSWSEVHKEDLFRGLSVAFRQREGNFHLFIAPDFNAEEKRVNLQIKLRLPTEQFGSTDRALRTGKAIVFVANREYFPTALSILINGNQTNSGQWRWLRPQDLTVNASWALIKVRAVPSHFRAQGLPPLSLDPSHFKVSRSAVTEIAISALIMSGLISIFFVWKGLVDKREKRDSSGETGPLPVGNRRAGQIRGRKPVTL